MSQFRPKWKKQGDRPIIGSIYSTNKSNSKKLILIFLEENKINNGNIKVAYFYVLPAVSENTTI